jgi:hypothetical protein
MALTEARCDKVAKELCSSETGLGTIGTGRKDVAEDGVLGTLEWYNCSLSPEETKSVVAMGRVLSI